MTQLKCTNLKVTVFQMNCDCILYSLYQHAYLGCYYEVSSHDQNK